MMYKIFTYLILSFIAGSLIFSFSVSAQANDNSNFLIEEPVTLDQYDIYVTEDQSGFLEIVAVK